MAKPFDATTKHLIEAHPQDWLACVGIRGVEVEPIAAELSTVTAEADQVLQVKGANSHLVHFELQTSYDPDLGSRVLQYNVLLDRRYRLPVRSVVFLLRKEADGPAMSGVVSRHVPGSTPHLEFHYDALRVWEQPVERFLGGGLGTLPLAPIARVSSDSLRSVVHRMEARIKKETSPSEAAWLWTATYVLMGLRYSEELAANLLQGVRAMKESATYQAIVREGEVKGARETLLRLGAKRFGQAGVSVRMALESIESPEHLERLADRVLDVESWDDLLAGT